MILQSATSVESRIIPNLLRIVIWNYNLRLVVVAEMHKQDMTNLSTKYLNIDIFLSIYLNSFAIAKSIFWRFTREECAKPND